MLSVLAFGFLLGVRHALDADHLAAVATLTSRSTTLRRAVRHGLAWGIGHTVTLFVAGMVVLFVTDTVPREFARWLELAVGAMLIGLGGDLLVRIWRDRVHFHRHAHGDGTDHFHAHSHRGEPRGRHDPRFHRHAHASMLPLRALLVGMMHGMAGSAALMLLTLQALRSPWLGLIYIALFGLGSLLGMGLFSALIAVPLGAARRLTGVYNTLQAAIGAGTMVLGIVIIAEFAPV
jgi:ABC-type nickel/cobalt efflux system permease component RcnA